MKCENCGCIMSAGFCSNCSEEAYIFYNQYEYLPDTLSDDFTDKVKDQIEEKNNRR